MPQACQSRLPDVGRWRSSKKVIRFAKRCAVHYGKVVVNRPGSWVVSSQLIGLRQVGAVLVEEALDPAASTLGEREGRPRGVRWIQRSFMPRPLERVLYTGCKAVYVPAVRGAVCGRRAGWESGLASLRCLLVKVLTRS